MESLIWQKSTGNLDVAICDIKIGMGAEEEDAIATLKELLNSEPVHSKAIGFKRREE